MKVAIPTEDRENVSEHFGRSPNFLVITVEGKEIVSREMRKKPGHEEFAMKEEHPQTDEKGRQGSGALASKRHGGDQGDNQGLRTGHRRADWAGGIHRHEELWHQGSCHRCGRDRQGHISLFKGQSTPHGRSGLLTR